MDYTMKTFPFLNTKADIEKAAKSIKTRSGSLSKDTHIALVSAIKHIEEHGNVQPLNAIIDGMSKGLGNRAKAWAEAFGKVTWDGKQKFLAFDKSKTSNVSGALNVPFDSNEFKQEAEYKAIDLMDSLEVFVKRMLLRAANAQSSDNIDLQALSVLCTLNPKASKGYTLVKDDKGELIKVNVILKARKAA